MRYLVTGGAGFIGSNLVLSLEQEGHEVTIIDNFNSGHEENIKGFKGTVIRKDISQEIEVEGKLDAIFHEAAITDPRHGNDEETMRQNIEGFKNMIELSKEKKAKLIYASTANLYGNVPPPQKEDGPTEIITAYGRSKLEMDKIAGSLFDRMHIVGLRYFNVFGPNERHKGRPASMIYHLAKQMKEGKNPRLFKWGEQKRDHIYVKDCVYANKLALEAPPGIYNVGTGRATSFKELVEELNKVLKTDLEPEYFDMPYDPKTYQENTQADTKKAEKDLGFKARYSLQQGLEEYIPMIR
jgi:ADP-L-glycero-D-manno-heptose 6-epimerase